jgi:hypothetical protein
LTDTEKILQRHDLFLKSIASRYSYLGYQDIYNQAFMYLLEAYQQNLAVPYKYAESKIKTFVRQENQHRSVQHYGLYPEDIIEKEDAD